MTDQEPLDFERAEFDAGADQRLTCEFCSQPVSDYYYHVAGKLACKHCQPQLAAALVRSPRFGRAVLFGVLAAVAGSAVWYGIIAATGYEVGLIAIAVGLLVGTAVRKGAGGIGGLNLQILAVFLTYSSIVFAYTPFVLRELRGMGTQQRGPGGVTSAGSESIFAGDLLVTESAVAEADAFLNEFDAALTAWTDSATDRAARNEVLERTYTSLGTLLASDSAPSFGFGDSIVAYHGVPLSAHSPWVWSARLAEAGYPGLSFDPSVTRLDLVSLLDGVSSDLDAAARPSGMTAAVGIAFLVALLYLAPFLGGFENAIGILIIGFALWEAWRINKRPEIEITGPFEVRAAESTPT